MSAIPASTTAVCSTRIGLMPLRRSSSGSKVWRMLSAASRSLALRACSSCALMSPASSSHFDIGIFLMNIMILQPKDDLIFTSPASKSFFLIMVASVSVSVL